MTAQPEQVRERILRHLDELVLDAQASGATVTDPGHGVRIADP